MSQAAHKNESIVAAQRNESVLALDLKNLNENDHEEFHNDTGSFIKSAVYGGLDGIITTYSVVMGVAGANLATIVILALGIANLIGDGICMALGDYLSTKSEIEFLRKERAREEWEVINNPEGEKREMIEIYQQRGISKQDASDAVEILSKNSKAWVDIMMVEELGLLPIEENPVKNAAITFIAFLVFGIIPLIPFIVIEIAQTKSQNMFEVSTGMTAAFLFILGYTKSIFTYSKWYKSGLETLMIGAFAAGTSYLIGMAFRPLTENASV